MVREKRNCARVEVGQQRDRNTTIHIDSPECHGPSGAIACAKRDFITLAYSSGFKEDAEALYVDGQLCIGKGVSILVTQGFLGPVLADRVLKILQIVPHIILVFIKFLFLLESTQNKTSSILLIA
jgi:hypothetical protein